MTGGLGLVLSGGGAPAAYFGAGVMRAIEDAGLRPRVVSGVSAGALNACALGIGMAAADLEEMWTSVRWRDIFQPRTDVWRLVKARNLPRLTTNMADYTLGAIGWTWLLDTTPARRTLSRLLGGEDLKIRDDVTVIVSAVNMATAEMVRFCSAPPARHRYHHEFRTVSLGIEHLLASTAVPLLFPPGGDGDEIYVDAGMIANTPLAPVMAYEPDAVIVVSGSGIARPASPPSSLAEAIGLLVNNVAHFALLSDYQHAQTVNTLARVAPQATTDREVPILLIEPTKLGFTTSSFLRFSPDDAPAIIEYGRREAELLLADWH